jgi:hypothetical protein
MTNSQVDFSISPPLLRFTLAAGTGSYVRRAEVGSLGVNDPDPPGSHIEVSRVTPLHRDAKAHNALGDQHANSAMCMAF